MRTRSAAGLSLLALATVSSCRSSPQAQPAPGAQPPAAVAASASSRAAADTAPRTEHVVRMVGDRQGYRFEPASLTVRQGDKVRFAMVSGGPHNVAFDTVSIPAGAKAKLAENTSSSMGNFMGPMMLTPDEAYIVSFAGLPPGTYAFYCMPHLAMSQRGTITVR